MNGIHFRIVISTVLWISSPEVMAQVYKCKGADGTISYQEAACDPLQQESLPITIKSEGQITDAPAQHHPNQGISLANHAKKAETKFFTHFSASLESLPRFLKDNSSSPLIISIIFFAAAAAVLIPFSRRKPKEDHFICSRCNKLTPYTPRTIEAWRHDKKSLFCQECHSRWLQSRPMKSSGAQRDSNTGCLGIVVIFAAVPLSLLLFGLYF